MEYPGYNIIGTCITILIYVVAKSVGLASLIIRIYICLPLHSVKAEFHLSSLATLSNGTRSERVETLLGVY